MQGNMSAKKRYRPLWVILHWLMALLIFAAFGIGLLSLVNTSNTGQKLVPLAVHMTLGLAILLIVTLRFLMRMLIYKPVRRTASTPAISAKKNLFLDQLTPYVHPLLYFFTALMALLGVAIALPANLFPIVFGRSGASLPANFYVFPTRTWHGTISLVLMLLIVQNVLVAIFHQFLKGENFLGRMWFTKK